MKNRILKSLWRKIHYNHFYISPYAAFLKKKYVNRKKASGQLNLFEQCDRIYLRLLKQQHNLYTKYLKQHIHELLVDAHIEPKDVKIEWTEVIPK